jgi:hypothetical protein
MRTPWTARHALALILVLAASVTTTACGDAAETVDSSPSVPDGSDTGGESATALADCSEEVLTGGDDEFEFTSAYDVIDGELSDVCFGSDDPVIVDAWNDLATITPPGQLTDLALFGGFEPDGDGAAETLAFVDAIDVDGSQFLMSVNTVEATGDPDELLLTLAHEFSHVFTATGPQLDRTDEAIDACGTYFNGDGCYRPEALMLAWIDAFWDDDLLAGVDPLEDSPEDADERCSLDDGFFGAYAATNPEEDFAEAFSAFVFRVEPATEGQAERIGWIEQQPGLAEFRDRAEAAGMTPLANNFDLCG